MAGFWPGYVTGVVVMAATSIAVNAIEPSSPHIKKVSVPATVAPCAASQIGKAVIHGGTQSFTTPSGQKVEVTSPTGAWCEVQ